MRLMPPIRTRTRTCASSLALLTSILLWPATVLAEDMDENAQREANFKAADSEGKGELDPAAFQAFIDANAEDGIGRAATIQRFRAYERAFKQVDQDQSGTVSWEEIQDQVSRAE